MLASFSGLNYLCWLITMRLSLLLFAPCVLSLCFACSPGSSRPNILFVSIDTLRADHLGVYGFPRPTSPSLDAFAQNAVVFEQADSSASWTLPSLASMMTSLYTSSHNCWKLESRLDNSYRTLAETLRESGYDTSLVASYVLLSAAHGLQQGFTHVDTRISQKLQDSTSAEVSDAGIRWIRQKAAVKDGVPWFLWLHYFDPHGPYVAHPGISEKFGTQTDIDLYDGEIAYTDQHIGRLLTALDQSGLADNTIVVVVADHGEEFSEHGNNGHGSTLYEEVVRVPLIIRAPGIAARRVAAVTPTVDLMPTLLELCGVDCNWSIEGVSLLPLMRGESPAPRLAVSETQLHEGQDMKSVRSGRWKCIDHGWNIEGYDFLFDLDADPTELHDVSEADPTFMRRMRTLLDERIARAVKLAGSYQMSELSTMPPAQLDRLRGLGYIGSDGRK